MATTAAVIGAVTGVAAAGNSIYQGNEASKAAKKQRQIAEQSAKKQEINNQKAEQKSLLATAQGASADIKAQDVTAKANARDTSKVNERTRRKGKGSLLTGSESGSSTSGSTLGTSSVQL